MQETEAKVTLRFMNRKKPKLCPLINLRKLHKGLTYRVSLKKGGFLKVCKVLFLTIMEMRPAMR